MVRQDWGNAPDARVMDVGKAETVGAAERMYSEINNGLSI